MAIDRGGLQYTITIEDAFSQSLGAFIEGVRTAKRELESLRKSRAAVAESNKAVRELARATRESVKIADESAKKERKIAAIRRDSIRAVSQETRRAAVAQLAADQEVRNRLNNARRLATENQKLVTSEREVTKIVNARGRAERVLRSARERNIRLSDEERRARGLMTATERELFDVRKRLEQFSRQGTGEIARINAETEALRRRNRVAREIEVQKILNAKGFDKLGNRIGVEKAEQKRFQAFFDRVRKTLKGAENQANRVSFTFRRLFGILAAFAAARAIVRGFRQIIAETIRFSAAIEQATLGIGSLFLAVGDVRDISGQTVTTAQGLDLALAEARRQMQLLRRDALTTAATFEELLDAFQIGLAPGLQSGLSVEQVRKFALDISRAAAAIGLPQNQLAEEIRSILEGTIQARTTRIAVALGITNEDIRRAKEAGVLFEFLQEKFGAFEAAGERALTTFSSLWANLFGGFQQVLEQGGLDFFETLKGVLRELFDLVVQQDPLTETLTPNPRAVTIVRAFAAGLEQSLVTLRAIAKSLTFDDLTAAAVSVAGVLSIASRVIFSLISGALKGLQDLGRIGLVIGNVFKRIFNQRTFNIEDFQKVLEIGARILTVYLGITATTAILKLGLSGVLVVLGAIVGVGLKIKAIWVTLNTLSAALALKMVAVKALILAKALGAALLVLPFIILVEQLKKMYDEAAGVELKFISFLKLLKVDAVAIFERLVNAIAKFFNIVVIKFEAIVGQAFAGLNVAVAATFEAILKLVARFIPGLDKALDAVTQFKETQAGLLQKRLRKEQEDLAAIKAIYESAARELDERVQRQTVDIIRNDRNERTVKEWIADQLRDAGKFLQEIGGTLFDFLAPDLQTLLGEFSLENAVLEADSLTKAFFEVNGIINRNRDSLAKNVDLVRELKDEAEEVANALDLRRRVLGLEGPIVQILENIQQARVKTTQDALFLERSQQNLLFERVGIQNQIIKNEQRISALNRNQQTLLSESEGRLLRIAQLQREAAFAENRRIVAQVEANGLLRRGFQELAQTAQERADSEQAIRKSIEEQVEQTIRLTDEAFEQAEISNEEREEARQSLLTRLQLNGQLQILEDSIRDTINDQVRLESARNAILADRLSAVAAEEAVLSRRRQAENSAELLRSRAQALEASGLIRNAEARARVASAELEATRQEIRIAREIRDASLEALSKTIEQRAKSLAELQRAVASGQFSGDEEEELLKNINALERERLDLINLRTQLQAEAIQEAEKEQILLAELARLADEERRKAEEPIDFGFEKGLEEFLQNSLDVFDKFKSIVAQGFEGLSQTIGKSITDAFTGEGTNFREQFRQFLARTAEQIISMLVQIAIAKAILGLGFGPVGFSGGGAVAGGGLAKGGRAGDVKPRKIAVVVNPFANAKGFAKGGLPTLGAGGAGGKIPPSVSSSISNIQALRPRSVDPRDKIPIWAAPNEWVIQAKAVKTYGSDVMNALNSMLIDPTALRAIAGINQRGRVSRKVAKAGAATGGQITSTSGAPTVRVGAGTQTGDGMPALAVVAGTPDTMQQLLRGGRAAMLDFLRSNKDEFMGEDRGRQNR